MDTPVFMAFGLPAILLRAQPRLGVKKRWTIQNAAHGNQTHDFRTPVAATHSNH